MRFPFTFMGVMSLAVGLWVLVYLAVHKTLDPVSQGIALTSVAALWAFAGYVLVRRAWRGPQH